MLVFLSKKKLTWKCLNRYLNDEPLKGRELAMLMLCMQGVPVYMPQHAL